MKHWNALNEMETEVIRVSELNNLLNLVINGIEAGSTNEQIQSGLYTISGMLEDISENLDDKFQALFNDIRQEDAYVKYTADFDPEFEEDAPKYDFEPLEEVVNTWIRK
jgi:hypothetical protein